MTEQAVTIKFRQDLLGKEYDAGSFEVKKEEIIAYSRAVGETNPIYVDEQAARKAGYVGVVAPPSFCNLFIRQIGRPDIKVEFGTTQMHGGQAMEPLATVVAGDKIHGKVKLKEVYAKTGRTGTMVFIVWETSFTNQRGETVALIRDSHLRR